MEENFDYRKYKFHNSHNRQAEHRIYIRNRNKSNLKCYNNGILLVNNWKELSMIPNESDTHILYVDLIYDNAYLKCKNPKDYNINIRFEDQIKYINHYISTNSFYRTRCESVSRILQECGFNVQLISWD